MANGKTIGRLRSSYRKTTLMCEEILCIKTVITMQVQPTFKRLGKEAQCTIDIESDLEVGMAFWSMESWIGHSAFSVAFWHLANMSGYEHDLMW